MLKNLILVTGCLLALGTASLAAEAAPKHHRHGVVVKSLPHKHVKLSHGKHRYFFHGGVYYRAHKNGYRIVAAPLGYRLHVLPKGHIRFKLGPVTYFYMAGNYYRQEREYYVVVPKPVGAPNLETEQDAALLEALFVYPNKGQSKKQTVQDKTTCQDWATRQDNTSTADSLQRAYGVCLTAKGYTVG